MLENSQLKLCNNLKTGEAALRYLEIGLWILPIESYGARPITANGVYDAMNSRNRKANRTDQDIIDSLAYHNLAIRTGEVVDVLDVDHKNGKKPGLKVLAQLRDAGLLEGRVAIEDTPNGGKHVYFPTSGGRGGYLSALGLEFKAAGGYVVSAPSYRWNKDLKETIHYKWRWSRALEEGMPLDWTAIKDFLGVSEQRSWEAIDVDPVVVLDRLSDWLTGQYEGNRNSGLYWAARRALEQGANPDDLIDAAIFVGLSRTEAKATIASAKRGHDERR